MKLQVDIPVIILKHVVFRPFIFTIKNNYRTITITFLIKSNSNEPSGLPSFQSLVDEIDYPSFYPSRRPYQYPSKLISEVPITYPYLTPSTASYEEPTSVWSSRPSEVPSSKLSGLTYLAPSEGPTRELRSVPYSSETLSTSPSVPIIWLNFGGDIDR